MASQLASEAVDATLKYARDNPGLLPRNATAAERWLTGVLRNRVLCIAPRKRLRPNDGRAIRLSYIPAGKKASETGTASHYRAETAEDLSTDSGDSIFDELKLCDRELLFLDPASATDWQQRKRQAELRERLKVEYADRMQLSPGTSLLCFVSQFASPRSLDHYLSQFRTLGRSVGRTQQLRDLTPEFYERYVVTLSPSSRKRVLSIWNRAAHLGIVDRLWRKVVRADHPRHWPDAKLAMFCKRANELTGEVLGTAIPNSEYWPAMVCLAADSRLNLRQLRQLTWPMVKVADWLLRPRTVDYLAELERWKYGPIVFPWLRSQASFWKHHACILRRCGIPNDLTIRERDVLVGTAAGLTEKDLANQLSCCIKSIGLYRRRLRDKLGLDPPSHPGPYRAGT